MTLACSSLPGLAHAAGAYRSGVRRGGPTAPHAAAQRRHEEGKRQVEALERELKLLRTQFSTDRERTREQVAVAQERASATERRALCEIDQEHTLRQKGEQALVDLRVELAAVQARARLQAHAQPAAGGGRTGARARRGGTERFASRQVDKTASTGPLR